MCCYLKKNFLFIALVTTRINKTVNKFLQKISNLVSKLPKFYALRKVINISNRNPVTIINQLKDELISEGRNVAQINLDLRFGQGNDQERENGALGTTLIFLACMPR